MLTEGGNSPTRGLISQFPAFESVKNQLVNKKITWEIKVKVSPL